VESRNGSEETATARETKITKIAQAPQARQKKITLTEFGSENT
jgi:hypothetical protein